MNPTHVPLRRCIGCGRSHPRAALRRFVRTGDGSVVAGPTAPGRGAWLCPGSESCAQAAITRRAFDRAFRQRCDPPDLADLLADL